MAAADRGRAVVVAASRVCRSVASHRSAMSSDAISRLITNITLALRSGMRHGRRGTNQRCGKRSQVEAARALVLENQPEALTCTPAGANVSLHRKL